MIAKNFLSFYAPKPHHALLVNKEVFQSLKPEEQLAYIIKYPLFALNTIFYIIDKNGQKVPLKMNFAQHKLFSAMETNQKILVLKARQLGVSTFMVCLQLLRTISTPNTTNAIITETSEAAKDLLTKAKFALSNLPTPILSLFLNAQSNPIEAETASKIIFSNGSTLRIATSLRGATVQNLHISELGKISQKSPKKAEEILTGAINAVPPNGSITIESTLPIDENIEHNLFKRLYYDNSSFHKIFFAWYDDPSYISNTPVPPSQEEQDYLSSLPNISSQQKFFWIHKFRELNSNIKNMVQEFPSSPDEFLANNSALNPFVFKTYIRTNPFVSNPYDPNFYLYVSMDLGLSDATVILFYQYQNDHLFTIDVFADTNKPFTHYIELIYNYSKLKPIKNIFVPHDASKRDKITLDTPLAKLVERFPSTVFQLQREPIKKSIDDTRLQLAKTSFSPSCQDLVSHLEAYVNSYNDLPEKSKKNKRHSDFADALRYAVASKPFCSTCPAYIKNAVKEEAPTYDPYTPY